MAKHPNVGDPAPDFELDGTDGRFKLSFRARRLMGDMAVLGKGEMLILA